MKFRASEFVKANSKDESRSGRSFPVSFEKHQSRNLFPLLRLTKEGYRVIYFRFTPNSSPSDFDHLVNCRATVNEGDYLITNETTVNGIFIIIDGKTLNFKHAKQIQPTIIKKMVIYNLEVFPCQLKGMLFFNCPSTIHTFTAIVFPLLSKKIKERIHIISGDHTELYKFFDKKILPRDYGGEEASIDELSDAWEKTIESFNEWLISRGSLLVDESKRPEKSENKCTELFGPEGSFRQLEID
ncbi:alpha-tocopherol transfer protein-like [Lycorma delicatula]|uniref:alpha-tocopherol transfer protein-like n=1 Tax=Lycorma delicatula TaxID=130591 RepID=UPI003F5171C8